MGSILSYGRHDFGLHCPVPQFPLQAVLGRGYCEELGLVSSSRMGILPPRLTIWGSVEL